MSHIRDIKLLQHAPRWSIPNDISYIRRKLKCSNVSCLHRLVIWWFGRLRAVTACPVCASTTLGHRVAVVAQLVLDPHPLVLARVDQAYAFTACDRRAREPMGLGPAGVGAACRDVYEVPIGDHLRLPGRERSQVAVACRAALRRRGIVPIGAARAADPAIGMAQASAAGLVDERAHERFARSNAFRAARTRSASPCPTAPSASTSICRSSALVVRRHALEDLPTLDVRLTLTAPLLLHGRAQAIEPLDIDWRLARARAPRLPELGSGATPSAVGRGGRRAACRLDAGPTSKSVTAPRWDRPQWTHAPSGSSGLSS